MITNQVEKEFSIARTGTHENILMVVWSIKMLLRGIIVMNVPWVTTRRRMP